MLSWLNPAGAIRQEGLVALNLVGSSRQKVHFRHFPCGHTTEESQLGISGLQLFAFQANMSYLSYCIHCISGEIADSREPPDYGISDGSRCAPAASSVLTNCLASQCDSCFSR